MNIISGKYRRLLIKGYELDKTRPTLNRVKESLFAMINPYLKDSKVLDLFTGSGALGLEALSNGSNCCIFNDNNAKAINVLKENITNLKVQEEIRIYNDDYQTCLNKLSKEKFDVIFLDPPYEMNVSKKIIKFIYEHKMLQENGLIICEERDKEVVTNLYPLFKEREYGKIRIKIFINSVK